MRLQGDDKLLTKSQAAAAVRASWESAGQSFDGIYGDLLVAESMDRLDAHHLAELRPCGRWRVNLKRPSAYFTPPLRIMGGLKHTVPALPLHQRTSRPGRVLDNLPRMAHPPFPIRRATAMTPDKNVVTIAEV